jgi:hypothetical protein
MKRNQFVLVAMALLIAFGMTACPTDVEDTELAGSVSISPVSAYENDEITATYSDTKEKNAVFTWVGPEGSSGLTATAKITPTVMGKYTVTVVVPGKEVKTASIVVGPAALKELATQTWYWKGTLQASLGSTGAGSNVQNTVEEIKITNNSFSVKNSIVRPNATGGFEYFNFTIDNWKEASIPTTPTGSVPLTPNNQIGYEVSGTCVASGYTELTSFKIYFSEGHSSFVRTAGGTGFSIYNSSGTGATQRAYDKNAKQPGA